MLTWLLICANTLAGVALGWVLVQGRAERALMDAQRLRDEAWDLRHRYPDWRSYDDLDYSGLLDYSDDGEPS